MDLNFSKPRVVKTNSNVKVESEYDQKADIITITITNSKQGYKLVEKSGNFCCHIDTKIAGLDSLKLSANLIALQ